MKSNIARDNYNNKLAIYSKVNIKMVLNWSYLNE